MGLFDKLFGRKTDQKTMTPDNQKLIGLLDKWGEDHNNYQSYSNVMNELVNGTSFLLLSSINKNDGGKEWKTLEKESTLKLTCIFDVDGLKILGAFTEEKTLLDYTKKETSFTAMKSQDVLNFCETNGIDRIVINSGQKNAFFTEKNKKNVQAYTFEKETTVEIATPDKPIEKEIVEKLIDKFSKVDSILEVYQYGQTKDNEFSIVLGFKLNVFNENSRTASINAVQRALDNSSFNQPLDIFFIETEDWYNSIKNVGNSLLYKK